jgi:hypothetical protein
VKKGFLPVRSSVAGQVQPGPRGSVSQVASLITIAVVVGVVAAYAPEWLPLVATAPVACWLTRRYRMLPIWLLTLEMVLGGWGHAVNLGSLPLRHAMLGFVMGTWLLNKMLDRDWALRGGRHAAAIALFLGVVVVAVLSSVAADNPFALEDGSTAFFALLVFPLADVASAPGGVRRLLTCFLWSVAVLGVVQITLAAGVFAGVISGDLLYLIFKDRFGGVMRIAGPFWRVFLVGSIYFQIALLLLGAGLLSRQRLLGRAADWLVSGTVAFSLLLTFTRGFWATAVVGFCMLAVLTTPRGRVRWIAAGLAAILLALLIVPVADVGLFDALGGRLMQVFDRDRDVGVALRLDLYPRLMGRIAERPWFGYGFGRLVEDQLYYENSYLYYAIKFGLVGLVALAVGWVLLVTDALRQARQLPDPFVRTLAAGLAAAIVSMLIVTSINPFINSSVGLYFQALAGALLYGLQRNHDVT